MNVAGIVLAGGRSSRMGSNKSLLQYEGKTLLERTKALLEMSHLTVYISASAELHPEAIEDNVSGMGPLGGISTIFTRHPEMEAFVVIPVDMPRLNSILIDKLLVHYEQSKNECEVIHFQTHELPAIICNTPKIRQYLVNSLQLSFSHARSLKEFFRNHKTLSMAYENEESFFNCNYPQEWTAFQEGVK